MKKEEEVEEAREEEKAKKEGEGYRIQADTEVIVNVINLIHSNR